MTTTTRWRLATLGLLGLGLCAAGPMMSSSVARLRWSDGSLIALGAPPAEGEAVVLTSGVLTGGTAGGTTITGTPTEGDAAIYTSGAWTATGGADARTALDAARAPVSSASAPGVSDDSGDGYAVGQSWVDTTADVPYVLVDATAGAAVWRSLLGARRAVAIAVVSGSLSWAEQVETSSGWATVTSWTALTTETDGGVTFSGANATLPSGLTPGTGCASQPDERYLLVSSLSATMQTLFAAGAPITLQASETSMGATADSRWGVALAVTGGTALDATSECIAGMRSGYTGTQWSFAAQTATSSYAALTTSATMGRRSLKLIGGVACAMLWTWTQGATALGGSTGTTKAALPDRIYWIAGASGTVSGTTLITAPVARIIAEVP